MTFVIACSGPGAMAAIESNERWGWKFFIGAAVVAVLALVFAIIKRRTTRWLWATIIATGLHPAVWMGARGGDCGHMLYFAAVAGSIIVIVFALLAFRGLLATGTPSSSSPSASRPWQP